MGNENEKLNGASMRFDKNIGVSGDKIYWMRSKCGKVFWCRMAISVMGTYNMTDEEISTISPFDSNFRDNFVEGKGPTKDEALEEMEKCMSGISDSLWYA